MNSQKLDYENPNERKFLLLVVAQETNTERKLSSTATVTVQVRLMLASQFTVLFLRVGYVYSQRKFIYRPMFLFLLPLLHKALK